MSEITNLILEATTGESYTTERYRLEKETDTRARNLERAPYGDTWFAVGDGRREPAPVTLSIVIRSSTLREALDEVQDVMRILDSIETLRWGEFHRPILGLSRVTRTQALLGYRLNIELLPTGPRWLDDLGNEAYL